MEYEVKQSERFRDWLKKLKDNVAKASIARRIKRVSEGNFGDSKFIGGGVYELRVDVGQGYRVYFTNRDNRIVFLLVGGDKHSQENDIEIAKRMAEGIQANGKIF